MDIGVVFIDDDEFYYYLWWLLGCCCIVVELIFGVFLLLDEFCVLVCEVCECIVVDLGVIVVNVG